MLRPVCVCSPIRGCTVWWPLARLVLLCGLILGCGLSSLQAADSNLNMTLRSRTVADDGRLAVQHESQKWDAQKTAIIVCDMWDLHHCLNAVRRVGELTPRINRFLKAARQQGVTIIHAPSSCMPFYKDHPARRRVATVPRAGEVPQGIESWCDWLDEDEQETGYPIDHSDGGEDDDLEEHARWAAQLTAMGRNPRSPWKRQVAGIQIDEKRDYITDDGVENWSILQAKQIENVMLVGVHTNMCVLGRPFGLRQLSRHGKRVVLVRDLTDTMYNPRQKPYVSHFSGTDLVIEHIEQRVCPTVASTQLLEGRREFRFRDDRRPHVVMLIGEREYQTAKTLPKFARQHLYRDMKVSYVVADSEDKNLFPGIDRVRDADLLLISVRRRTPSKAAMRLIRNHVRLGKPVVGIRTASHAFALRNGARPPAGHAMWQKFDQEVFGGNYHGHHNNKKSEDISTYVWGLADASAKATDSAEQGGWDVSTSPQRTTAWLYKTSPLQPGARVLMMGRVGDRQPHEPVSWTYIHSGGGRSFYTSLGHEDDFATPDFQALLNQGIRWALDTSATGAGS